MDFGLFETIRAEQGKIIYFAEHINRLLDSARRLNFPCAYSADRLKNLVSQAVKRSSAKDAYVKLILWNTPDGKAVSVITKSYHPPSQKKYAAGFKAVVSPYHQTDPLLAGLKTTSRFLYQLSLEYARKMNSDEAIILNPRGNITEGSKSNLFFVYKNEIFTPSLECGCLAGITRRAVFDLAKKNHLRTREGKFTLNDLYNAEEAFLTNSLMGIMPLTFIAKKRIGRGKCGKITKLFSKKYHSLLK